MSSAAQLIDDIRSGLDGFGVSSDSFTRLTAPVGAADTSFTVDVGPNLDISAGGAVEIGSELLYVTAVDSGDGTVTVATDVGRGFDGTTPAAHPGGALVVSQPRFPRHSVLTAINESLADLYPAIYAIQWVEVVGDGVNHTFPLPAGTSHVKVAEQLVDTRWRPIRSWNLRQGILADPPSVELMYVPAAADTLRFAVALPPTPLVEADDITASGIPVDVTSVVKTATQLKLVPGSELDRLQITTVEQSDRASRVPASAGLTASRYLQLVKAEQMAAATAALNTRFPKQIRRSF